MRKLFLFSLTLVLAGLTASRTAKGDDCEVALKSLDREYPVAVSYLERGTSYLVAGADAPLKVSADLDVLESKP